MNRTDPIAWPPARETAARAGLSGEAAALIDGDGGPRGLLDRLAAHGLFADAVRQLAFALPPRAAVWWACRCIRSAPGGLADGPAAAVDAAGRWASAPDEDRRRAAAAAAEAAGAATPAGCAALAAFWSGGSLAPPGLPEAPPPPDLTPKGVAGAVLLAGLAGGAPQAPDLYRRFLDLGLAVAAGDDRWPDDPAAATAAAAQPPAVAARTGRASRFADTWE